MQECETGTDKGSMTKRVTVRSGGAGHAHSGIVKTSAASNANTLVANEAVNKIVKLGR